MPRPTSAEIDGEILDSAARLIAQHGMRQTSVQAVADAVGYSKAGLLHRFPSKEALQAAVLAHCRDHSAALLADVSALPPGAERDRTAITALAHLAQRRPGFTALLLSTVSSHDPSDLGGSFEPVGRDLMAAFGVDVEPTDPARLVAVIGALGALSTTSLALRTADPSDPTGRWVVPHIITACLRTLGHPAPEAGPTAAPASAPDPSAPAEKGL